MAFKRNKEDTRYYFRSRQEEWSQETGEGETGEYARVGYAAGDHAAGSPEENYYDADYPAEAYADEHYAQSDYQADAYRGGYDEPGMDEETDAAYTIDMDGDDLDYLDDETYHEERKLRRLGRFRVAAGVFDFLGVIAGMIAVLVLIALLVSLLNWLQADILRSVTILQSWF